MMNQESSEYDEAIPAFKAQLEKCTQYAACGRPYILVSKLTQWMDSKVRVDTAGQSYTTRQANRLLHAAYNPGRWDGPALPIDVNKLFGDRSRCLLVFSILLELRLSHLIHHFFRKDKVDRHLPIDLNTLESTFRAIETNEADERAKQFDNIQWRFCPVQFDLDMSKEFWKDFVLPICNKQPINLTKGALPSYGRLRF
jgi:hypothetical protein